jgi:hypothetical protein
MLLQGRRIDCVNEIFSCRDGCSLVGETPTASGNNWSNLRTYFDLVQRWTLLIVSCVLQGGYVYPTQAENKIV